MATYRQAGPSLYELDTPVGPTLVQTSEDELRNAGHEPAPELEAQPTAGGELVRSFPEEAPPADPAFGGEYGQIFRQDPYARLETAPNMERPSLFDPRVGAGAGPVGFSSAGQRSDRELAAMGMGQPAPGPEPAPVRQGVPSRYARDVDYVLGRLKPDFEPSPASAAAPLKSGRVSVPISGPADAAEPAEPTAQAGFGGVSREQILGQVAAEAARGGGPVVQTSPGGMVLTGVRAHEKAALPEGTLSALDPDYAKLRALGATQQQANRDLAARMQEEELARAARIAEEQQRRAEIDAHINRLGDEANKRWQEAAAAEKLDPERLSKNRSTLGQVAAFVSIFLSRVGAGLNKTPAFAEEEYNRAKDKDIEAQRDEYERKRQRSEAANNAFAREVHLWGTPELAKKSLSIQWDELRDAKLKRMTLLAQNPEIEAKIEEFIQQKQAERAVQKAQLLQQGAAEVEKSYTYQKPTYSGGGARGILPVLRKTAEGAKYLKEITGKGEVKPELQYQKEKNIQERFMPNLPDGPGFARRPEDAAKLDKAMAQHEKLIGSLDRAENIMNDLEKGKISTLEAYSKLETLKGSAGVAFKEASGLGAWDNGVERLVGGTIGVGGKGVLPGVRGFYKNKIHEYKREANLLMKSTLRNSISRDPNGKKPYYEKEPE